MIPASSGTSTLLASLRRQPAGKRLARSLAASRFIDFPDNPQDKDWRRRSATAIREGAADSQSKLKSWRAFALRLAGSADSPGILFARQESRLLINMAGGVFENGGLSLDRISGVPFIPGSAVKGCARRLALAALQEWTSGELTAGDPANLLAPAIDGVKDPGELLFHIALIFGWSDAEWLGPEDFSDDQKWRDKRSDFAWACGDQWIALRESVASRLCDCLHIQPKLQSKAWKNLPHYAGAVSFLPAYPWKEDPGIDLDVITCHHGEYYKRPKEPENVAKTDPKWLRWKQKFSEWEEKWGTAPDTEEPVPVIFPAVAPDKIWAFLIHPSARALDSHVKLARCWLAVSLETLGIGAKTNAGYGWFDTSEETNAEVRESIAAATLREEQEAAQRAREEQKKQDDEKRRQDRENKAAATDGMTADQKADWELAQWSPAQFANKVQAFFKEPRKGGPTDEERKAIVRALRGPKLEVWTEFKAKALKGDPAKAADAIRQLNKQLHGDRMP